MQTDQTAHTTTLQSQSIHTTTPPHQIIQSQTSDNESPDIEPTQNDQTAHTSTLISQPLQADTPPHHTLQPTAKLRLLYTNADSLTNKVNELNLLAEIEKPDIICITETLPKFCPNSNANEIEFPITGYTEYHNRIGRGVSIFTKEGISAEEIELNTNFNSSVWIKIQTTQKPIVIGCMYRSPNSPDINNNEMLKAIELASDLDKSYLLITGDFNLKEIDWPNLTVQASPHHYAQRVYDKLNDLFLEQLVTEPTRHRQGEQANLLDWLLTDSPYAISDIQIQAPLGEKGDHNTIFANIDIPVLRQKHVGRYNWYKGNYIEITKIIKATDWQSEFLNKNCNKSWDTLCSTIQRAMRDHIPITTGTSKYKNIWVDKKTKEAIRDKKKAWYKYKKHKTEENWNYFTRTRNQTNRLIVSRKGEFEGKIASEIKSNPKQFWRYVNSKKSVSRDFPTLIDSEGSAISEDQQKADLFNRYFASVYTVENEHNIPVLLADNINIAQNDKPSLETITITEELVFKYLSNINQSKAAGPDEIHPRVLHEVRSEVTKPLSLIFSKSLDEGKIPLEWKHAIIKPIHKKGKKSDPCNYRPVSLTSVPCKILERIIRDKLVTFLETNNLLNINQHGFRSGRSCVTQLIEIMEIWTDLMDKNIPFDTIYLDFSKAFDKVPHTRLGKKINRLGITGKLLLWIKDFLHHRTQSVKINNAISAKKPITSGIPQGSVLGPILFLIFINDLPDEITSTVKIFADDTKIFRAINSGRDQIHLQEDLDRLLNWSKTWLLPFNIEKCKIIHYGPYNPKHSYTMENKPLKTDTNEKDLGIHFDDKLRFTLHIRKSVAKANSRLGLIKRNFTNLTPKVFLPLYKSLIRPLLEYGSCIWNPYLLSDINEIEKVQRRATKLVKEISQQPYTNRLKHLKLDSLKFRRKRYDIIQVYRIVHEIDNIDLNHFFEYHTGPNTRGHSFKLKKPRAEKNIKLHSFSHRIIQDWNSLTDETVNKTSINSFKTALQNEWAEHLDRYLE